MFQEVGNFVGQDACLARTRSGNDQQRAVAMAHGFPLAVVELFLPETVGAHHEGSFFALIGVKDVTGVAVCHIVVCVDRISLVGRFRQIAVEAVRPRPLLLALARPAVAHRPLADGAVP